MTYRETALHEHLSLPRPLAHLRLPLASLALAAAFFLLGLVAPLVGVSSPGLGVARASCEPNLDSAWSAQSSGSTTYTNSLIVNVDNVGLRYGTPNCAMNGPVQFLVVSNTANTPAKMKAGGYAGQIFLIGTTVAWSGDYSPLAFDTSRNYGTSPSYTTNSAQGYHNGGMAYVFCGSNILTTAGKSSGYWAINPVVWMQSLDSTCTTPLGLDLPSIYYDSVAPTWSGFTDPSATTTYRTSTSYTFAWNAASDTPPASGISGYHRVLQSAAISSPGVCGSWSNITDHGLSTATSILESGVLSTGLCWSEAVQVIDNASNTSGWNYANAVLVDTSAPNAGVPVPSRSYTNASNNSPGWSVSWSVASDVHSGVAAVTLTELSAAPSAGACPAPGSSWTVVWTTANLGPGATSQSGIGGGSTNTCYAYKINVTDKSGNAFSTLQGAAILVDTGSPLITWTTPAGNNTSGTVTPSWIVTDNGGSGVEKPGTVTRFYQPLTNNVCSGPMTNDGEQTNGSPVTLVSGRCYHWTFSPAAAPADKAGNNADPSGLSSTAVRSLAQSGSLSILRAGAIILNCGDPTNQNKWITNDKGIVYWGVAQPLCLVPTTDTTGPVFVDTSDPRRPLIGYLKSLDSYTLGDDPNNHSKVDVTWPTNEVGIIPWVPSNPAYLRFVINRETSLASTSAPWVLVPYQAQVTIAWCAPADTTCLSPVRLEQSVVNLQLRLVGLNSGQTR